MKQTLIKKTLGRDAGKILGLLVNQRDNQPKVCRNA